MSDKLDMDYICTCLSNLSGIPVGLYENDKQIFFYSIVSLPKDPFSPFIKELISVSEHIGYFITPHGYYYGVVNFKEKRLVLGPTRQIPIDEQELKEMAFEWDVPRSQLEDFVKGMKCLPQLPLQTVLQTLCMVNYVLNDGEKLSLPDISIIDLEQKALIEKLEIEAAERTLKTADEEQIYPHNTLDVESFMLEAVRKGDVARLKKLFENIPAIRSGVMAQDGLRQAKNLFIVATTLVSRAAIYGGMDAEEALTLSDGYIQKCELMNTLEAVTNLNYRLVIDYAERMEKLHYGKARSKLVIDVNNYVRRHLSEPISVEQLANHLNRGRSRLSTDFKKETGEKLSEFIIKQKIEEGKKLLRYTDKAVAEIAVYLGFSSQSHFSRTFKKHVDLTPNEYRHSKQDRDR